MVREIFSADGADEKTRPIARWLLERQAEPNLLARDTGRLFLGFDLACAQCHDHPRIDDYAQRDYHGLAAFFTRTYLFQPDAAKPGFVAEQAKGEDAWISVFTKVSGTSRPRLAGGTEIDEPVIPGDAIWAVAPNDKDKNVRPVPAYSRRGRLTDVLVSDPAFRRNMANRLWGMVMGRCLVEPPDLMHSGNPPAHPAVLEVLAGGLAALKFDLGRFVQELALTKTFAQAFEPRAPDAAERGPLAARLPGLESAAAISKKESRQLGLVFTECVEAFEAAFLAGKPAMDEWSKSSKAHSDAVAARDKTEAELKQAQLNKESLIESIGLFREAAVAGKIASKTLANDKELAAAAKTFQDKLKKLEVDAAEAGKAIAARMAAAETAAMAVEPARMAAELRKPAADEARAKIAVTEKARDLADASKRQARVAAQQAEQKVREAKALLAYSESLEAAAPLLKQVGKRRGEVSQMEGLIAVHRAALAANAAALVPLESSAAETLAAALKARKTLEDAAEQLATLMDASGKAGAVLGKFPADGEVQAATKTLQARCEQARNDRDAAQVMLDEAETAATAAAAAHGSRRKEATEAQAALSGEETQLAKLQIAAEEAASGAMPARALMESASRDLAAVGTTVFSVSNLAPLPPEQLCWSILQATGTLGELHERAAKEWDEKNKPSDADKVDSVKRAARLTGIEELGRGKVKPHEDQFVRLFANSAGQPQSDFFATADQVLYFENAGSVRSWTNPSGNNLAARLAKLADARAFTEELYLSVLTRFPADAEIEELAAFIAQGAPELVRHSPDSDFLPVLLPHNN